MRSVASVSGNMAFATPDLFTSAAAPEQTDFFLQAFGAEGNGYSALSSDIQSSGLSKQHLDYFKIEPDVQNNGCFFTPTDLSLSNADLNQFFPDPNLATPDGTLAFSLAVPAQLDPQIISQYQTADALTTTGTNSSLSNSPQVRNVHKLSAKNLSHVKTSVQHGQVTPAQSLSPIDSNTTSQAGDSLKSRAQKRKNALQADPPLDKPKRGRRKKTETLSKEEQQGQRERFLERNRNAAAKCRINKKQWQENLKESVKTLGTKHARLNAEYAQLQHEYDEMRVFVVNHSRICPSKDTQDWVTRHANSMFDQSNDTMMMDSEIVRTNEDYTSRHGIALSEKSNRLLRHNSAPPTPSVADLHAPNRRVQSISFPSMRDPTVMSRSGSARSDGHRASPNSDFAGFEAITNDLSYFDQMH